MGYFGGDWEYGEYLNAVEKARANGRDCVSLDTEHCSWRSNESIKKWAEEDGYTVNIRMDNIIVYFKKSE